MTGHLDIWTIYDHPKDFPDAFIARRFEVRSTTEGGPQATADVIVSGNLKDIRREMRNRGLVCLTRQDEDDSAIIETWL